MKKKIKTTFILTFLLILANLNLYAETKSDINNEFNRKENHLYFSAYLYSKASINYLYGFTNKFYFGISFQPGEKAQNKDILGDSTSTRFDFIEYRKSNSNNYFNLKSHYFYIGNFYSSLDLGILTGFKEVNTIYTINLNPGLNIIPYSKTTTISDRYSMSLGLGYRREFFEHFLLGSEIQYGILSGGKVNRHYTFNPLAYRGLPIDYILDQLLIENNDYRTSRFLQISIYAGVAF
ncbi:hypothetical protein [Leptospira soteropolitanensis]|uniref:Outer membrane protein beta-barrel domain-containing protein n=2 Tax=Leptospira soteropolitanensis TaxID=2950025 RepID=A0AAW5VQI1_9LEPT|nr:hypothetical protein [Leptospira soteropolitanensis]MCW7502396.1 hypothetical protein [Leptospira soteropolitanensis]MCW7532365.1 hypothetical protein [Leptospira soteropolitanensis]